MAPILVLLLLASCTLKAEASGSGNSSQNGKENESGQRLSQLSVLGAVGWMVPLANKAMHAIRQWNAAIGPAQHGSNHGSSHPFSRVLTMLRMLVVPLPSGVSEPCRKHVRLFFTDLLDTFIEHKNPMDQWSIQMLDAMAKPPAGILRGSITWPGSFRQCTDVRVPSGGTGEADKETGFVGEHCMMRIRIPTFKIVNGTTNAINPDAIKSLEKMKLNVSIAICFPSTCVEADKNLLIRAISSPLHLNATIDHKTCSRKEPSSMDTTAIILSIVLLFPVLLVFVGTTLDYFKSNDVGQIAKGSYGSCLLTFSLQKSWNAVFSVARYSENSFDFLYGIRFLSIAWVVYIHANRAWVNIDYPWRESLNLNEISGQFYVNFIATATYAVDTFLFLSGFCAVYIFLKKNAQGSLSNTIMLYVIRYIRLTASYVYIIALVAGPWMYLGSGPLWYTNVATGQFCRKVWWTEILYIANFKQRSSAFISNDKHCMALFWYLMVDMQLFLIVPPILLLLIRKPKWGISLLCVLLVASTAGRGFILAFYKIRYIKTKQLSMEDYDKNFNYVYNKPYTRAPPYLIGMCTGYFLYTVGKTQIHIKLPWVRLGWLCSFAYFSFAVYVTHVTSNLPAHVSRVLDVGWGTTNVGLWGILLSWIVIACSTGHGGFVTRFLSCGLFVSLGRLSYCIFLTHALVLEFFYGSSMGETFDMNGYSLLNVFLSTMVISTAVSFCLHALVESPLAAVKFQLKTKPSKDKTSVSFKNPETTNENDKLLLNS